MCGWDENKNEMEKISRQRHWTKTNDCIVEDIVWYIGGNKFFPSIF